MSLSRKDFTPEFCQSLLDEHGTITLAAQSVVDQCVSERYSGRQVATRTVEEWIHDEVQEQVRQLQAKINDKRQAQRDANPVMGMDLARPDKPERVNRIDDLLEHANVALDAIGAIESVTLGAYGGFYKGQDEDGNPTAVKVPLSNTKIRLIPPNPNFPVLQPAPTTTIVVNHNAGPRILRKTRSLVVISDIQAGYLRDSRTDALEPIHDPLAIDVALQITADLQPEELYFIGDLTDLAMFSRWAQHPEYRGTLQPAINVTHNICGSISAAAGPKCKKKVVIGSNHDHRIEKSVLDWNKEALGIRRAGIIDGWPVFSLGYLARFDDLGLDWSGQYPGGECYIADDLVLMHAPPKSKEFQASVLHGHTHKVSRTPYVQHAKRGRQVYYQADVGCLCRTGVTDDKFRLIVTNTPSDRGRTDWVQGIAVVNIVDDSSGPIHSVDLIEIMTVEDRRMAIMGGQVYGSRADQVIAA